MNQTEADSNSESHLERIEFLVAAVIQVAILIVAIVAFVQGNWWAGVTGTVIFGLTFTPSFLEKRLRVRLPIELSLFICIFLFSSFVLGEVRDYYERLWWWDLALHGTSSFVVGLTGFLAVYVFYMTNRIRVEPIYVAVIAWSFAIAIGTFWEIFEFLMDWFFGFNMQKTGLVDTMTDLMINAAGGLAAAICGYFYVRVGENQLGHYAIRRIADRINKQSANPETIE